MQITHEALKPTIIPELKDVGHSATTAFDLYVGPVPEATQASTPKELVSYIGGHAIVGGADQRPHISEATQSTIPEVEPKIIYADKFRRWIDIEKRLSKDPMSDFSGDLKIKNIKEKNKIQSEFITYLAGVGTPKDQDQAVDDIFSQLNPSEQESFVNAGFIDGVAKEMLAYKYLLIYRDKLAEKDIKVDAELSTTDEDVHDGFDMKLTLPGNRTILFDAKSSMPIDASTKFRDPYHIGEKNKETRSGQPVYVLCPNPKKAEEPQYIQTRKLRADLPAVPSFVLPANYGGFVQAIHRTVNTIQERENAHRKALKSYVKQ